MYYNEYIDIIYFVINTVSVIKTTIVNGTPINVFKLFIYSTVVLCIHI